MADGYRPGVFSGVPSFMSNKRMPHEEGGRIGDSGAESRPAKIGRWSIRGGFQMERTDAALESLSVSTRNPPSSISMPGMPGTSGVGPQPGPYVGAFGGLGVPMTSSGSTVNDDVQNPMQTTWGIPAANCDDQSRQISRYDEAFGRDLRMIRQSLTWIAREVPAFKVASAHYSLMSMNKFLAKNWEWPLSRIREVFNFMGTMQSIPDMPDEPGTMKNLYVTVALQGKFRTQNVWSHIADSDITGCRLYLLLRKKRLSNHAQSKWAYQFEPAASLTYSYTDDDARAVDENGTAYPGYCEYVGLVDHPDQTKDLHRYGADRLKEADMMRIISPCFVSNPNGDGSLGEDGKSALTSYYKLPHVVINLRCGMSQRLYDLNPPVDKDAD